MEVPAEIVDYLLIKNLYHCTPSELDQQDAFILDLHNSFMMIEHKEESLKRRRQEQQQKMKAKR